MSARLLLAVLMACLTSPARGEPPAAPPPPPPTDRHGDPLAAGAVARLGTLRFHDPGFLPAAALSPDGKVLAVATQSGPVRLLDRASGKELRRLDAGPIGTGDLVFSPDGSRLAAVSRVGSLRLWDLATGKSLPALVAKTPRFNACSFSADGKLVATVDEAFGQKTLAHVFEVESGRARRHFEILPNYQGRAALSPDGKLLATCGNYMSRNPGGPPDKETSQSIQLWDVDTGKEVRRLRASGQPFAMAFTLDGQTLAVAEYPSAISLWDVAAGKLQRRLATRPGGAAFVAVSPDGKRVGTAGQDGVCQLWDLASGTRLGLGVGPRCYNSRLVITSGGQALACGTRGQVAYTWPVPSGEATGLQEGHAGTVSSIWFGVGAKVLLSAGTDGRLLSWDVATAKRVREVDLERHPRFGEIGPGQGTYAISPDGRYLAGTSYPRSIQLWETATGRLVCDLGDTPEMLQAPVFSGDGKVVGVAGRPSPQRKLLLLWDTDSGRTLGVPTLQGNQVSAIALSADRRLLAAAVMNFGLGGGGGGPRWAVHVGEADSEKALADVPVGAPVNALAFSPEGRLLACGQQNATVVLWDTVRRREVSRLASPQPGIVGPVVFSEDSRTLAAGVSSPREQRARVVLWEVASGHVRREFAGHAGTITCLAFSPDGRIVASGSQDTTVLLWDLTGRSGRPPRPREARDREALWGELGSTDASRAADALWALSDDPRSVEVLRKHLRPAAAADPARLAGLIAELDSAQFTTREKAAAELEGLGELAAPALTKALAAKPSPEVRRRLEALLEKAEHVTVSGDPLRALRAVEVLERLGTPEAQALLADLARGAPGARLTREAARARERQNRHADDRSHP